MSLTSCELIKQTVSNYPATGSSQPEIVSVLASNLSTIPLNRGDSRTAESLNIRVYSLPPGGL